MRKFIVLMFLAETAFCASNAVITTDVKLFDLAPDARSSGMGGAYTALSDDAGAVFYNPAGLAYINHVEIPLMQNSFYNRIDRKYAGFFYSLRDLRSANLKDPGTLAVFWETFEEGYFPNGDKNGNFPSSPRTKVELMGASYGKTLLEDEKAGTFMAGITARLYKQEAFNNNASWQADDAGVLWKHPDKNIFAGASVQNFNDGLPQTSRVGLAARPFDGRMSLAVDLVKPKDADNTVSFGAEYRIVEPLILRAGYNSKNDGNLGFSAGAGIDLKEVDFYFLYLRDICIDYTYASNISQGDIQYLTLILKLGAD